MLKPTQWCATALLLLLLLSSSTGLAAVDAFAFDDPAEEARYRALIDELRCPKCLNTNLSGSDSPISADLRAEVYRQVIAGHTDSEIRDYLSERYGDFILYRPRLTPWTALLYAFPFVLLLVGAVVVGKLMKSSSQRAAAVLDAEQTERLENLLKDGRSGGTERL